jgi:hypothetical protein
VPALSASGFVRNPDLYASGFLTVLAAAACVGAYRLGPGDVHNPGSGFMPMAAAGVLGLMAVVQLGRQLARASGHGAVGGAFTTARWGTVIVVLGALTGFAMALNPLGFSVADRLEKAFADAMKTEPFVSVARKNELIVGDRLSGQALADHLRKVSANYEGLIKEAGVYKGEKK